MKPVMRACTVLYATKSGATIEHYLQVQCDIDDNSGGQNAIYRWINENPPAESNAYVTILLGGILSAIHFDKNKGIWGGMSAIDKSTARKAPPDWEGAAMLECFAGGGRKGRAGWPSKTGNPSGPGRNNNPPGLK